MVFVRNYREHAGCDSWFAITARFALHKDEFDVVFYYCVGFIGLSQETSSVSGCLENCIGYLVPNDRREIIVADLSAMFLDRRMKRNNGMSTVVLSARQTDIADHAD